MQYLPLTRGENNIVINIVKKLCRYDDLTILTVLSFFFFQLSLFKLALRYHQCNGKHLFPLQYYPAKLAIDLIKNEYYCTTFTDS